MYLWAYPGEPNGTSITGMLLAAWLELADVGDAEDGGAGLVGGVQVDLRAEAPVVVAGRVVEDLARRPVVPVLLDDQQRGSAGVGTGADLAVGVEVRLQCLGPGVGVPAGLGVQLAQVLVTAQGGQLDPAEQGVAHQHPERALVAG